MRILASLPGQWHLREAGHQVTGYRTAFAEAVGICNSGPCDARGAQGLALGCIDPASLQYQDHSLPGPPTPMLASAPIPGNLLDQ